VTLPSYSGEGAKARTDSKRPATAACTTGALSKDAQRDALPKRKRLRKRPCSGTVWSG